MPSIGTEAFTVASWLHYLRQRRRWHRRRSEIVLDHARSYLDPAFKPVVRRMIARRAGDGRDWPDDMKATAFYAVTAAVSVSGFSIRRSVAAKSCLGRGRRVLCSFLVSIAAG